MPARGRSSTKLLGGSVALASVLVLGSACGGGETTTGDGRPGGEAERFEIPRPGANPSTPPPSLPRGPAMPTDTVSLADLHRQGKTDTVKK